MAFIHLLRRLYISLFLWRLYIYHDSYKFIMTVIYLYIYYGIYASIYL